MKQTPNLCRGKLKSLNQELGHSTMNKLWGGSNVVTYTSYKCEHGHEYETTGKDKYCKMNKG